MSTKVVVGCFATLRQLYTLYVDHCYNECFTRLVVALVLSRLDFCNGVLAGLSKNQLNSSSDFGARRRDHVTPLFRQLGLYWFLFHNAWSLNCVSWRTVASTDSALPTCSFSPTIQGFKRKLSQYDFTKFC